jgi:uncharacterized protein DUF2183
MTAAHPGAATPRHTFRWDLDKTYLKTDFDTLRGLLRSALEKAHDKQAVPGAPALLRALRAAGGPAHRISIISGSPEQMRKVLSAKLELDGVDFDEFVLKPNLSNLLRWRFRALRAQVPYKLPALLSSRVRVAAPGETLVGDDAESDALVYSLYADVLSGQVTRDELARIMVAGHAYEDQLTETLSLVDRVPKGDVVRRILIHLDRRSPTGRFDRFGARLVPVFNYFQAALVLYGDGQLASRDVVGVAREMLASGEYTVATLANSLQDLLRRGRMRRELAAQLALESQAVIDQNPQEWRDLPPLKEVAWAFATRIRALGGDDEPAGAAPSPLDYVSLVAAEERPPRE